MRVGVLALQGGVQEHREALTSLGIETLAVDQKTELSCLDGLILPGGESTTLTRLLSHGPLLKHIREYIDQGRPLLGTCAGLILLARQVDASDGLFGAIDICVERNAYGSQQMSFIASLRLKGLRDMEGVFIRAPRVTRTGPGVQILGSYEGSPVACRQNNVTVTSFHPELSDPKVLYSLLFP